MSALAPARLRARPAPAPAPARAERPSLSLVRPLPGVARRAPFALLVALVLAGGLVLLLMLHTLAAQDAFTLHDLQHRSAALADTEQQLALQQQQAAAPSTLAARARSLGLVPAGALQVIHRRDGRVVAMASAPAALPPRPATVKPATVKATVKPATVKATAKPATGKPATGKTATGAPTKPAGTTTTHTSGRKPPSGHRPH